ncbi:MAG: hypothetical protein J3K34DRAFT_521543 [Monoraphidium minutum]|nr:MAG: hypothetical protein J3K34DRAFT_521543 [Monoraphidium minutum]
MLMTRVVLLLLLGACWAAPIPVAVAGCLGDGASGGQWTLSGECVWSEEDARALAAGTAAGGAAALTGVRGGPAPDDNSRPATATILAPRGGEPGGAAPKQGARLDLARVTLSGFAPAPPGAPAPLLWPAGLLPGGAGAGVAPGAALRMTDCAVITDDRAAFAALVAFFSRGPPTGPDRDEPVYYWTDNATFLHIHDYSAPDGRAALLSVAVLLRPPPPPAGGAPPPPPPGALLGVTNATLVPLLLAHARADTAAPLLVYLASNVSLGSHPRLPARGVPVRRPLVIVGLQSLVTSIDLEMQVNQLNEAAGRRANVTFAGVVLENLAPGDAATSVVASPFSIAVVNNVWAAYYNRTVPNDVRLALFNTTMVIPETEISYVTYMFTMFTSTLPYLKQQTSFYEDVLRITTMQARFSPGPGPDAITVQRLKSWYHWWRWVVLTTRPAVAAPLPLPPRPLALSTPTRPSPLVQAVHSTEDLRAYAQEAVIGGRDHILLILANASLAPPAPPPAAPGAAGAAPRAGGPVPPVRLNSVMSWLGSSRGQDGPDGGGAARGADGHSHDAWLDCGAAAGAVVVPEALPAPALQLQQVVLWQLPQGPGVEGAVSRAGGGKGGRGIPAEVFALLLWSFERPMRGRALALDGVELRLRAPELDYLLESARRGPDFVVPLSGTESRSLAFEDAVPFQGGLRVGAVTGPGLVGSNLVLMRDTAPPPTGYVWPNPSPPPAGGGGGGGGGAAAPWVAPVAGALGALCAAAVGAGAFVAWRRRRWRARARGKGAGGEDGLGGAAAGADAWRRARSDDLLNAGKPPGAGAGASGGRAKAAPAGGGSPQNGTLDTLSVMYIVPGDSGSPPGSGLGSGSPAAAAAGAPAGAAAAGRSPGAPARARAAGGASGGGGGQESAMSLHESVAAGMQRWRSAVSSTTMALMERRMAQPGGAGGGGAGPQSGSSSNGGGGGGAAASSGRGELLRAGSETRSSCCNAIGGGGEPDGARGPASAAALGGGGGDAGGSGSANNSGSAFAAPQLQLLHILGSGSFGSVWLAHWRGKKVAVKVMHLPANALIDMQPDGTTGGGGGGGGGRARRRSKRGTPHMAIMEAVLSSAMSHPNVVQVRGAGAGGGVIWKFGRGSTPHMAIMEAVLSSAMSHPNVVQVYTYYLLPALVGGGGPHSEELVGVPMAGEALPGFGGGGGGGGSGAGGGVDIAGWTLKLVMEYCNEGSLRDALDCGLLFTPGSFLPPPSVLALAHDVASAMLHLHSEGIVHGDLKAHNVLLTGSTDPTAGMTNGRIWATNGGRRLTAKVGDFGMALPLQPTDTHASLVARGTPSHMSPELFLSGHVSKASDVYAFGVLLFEMMSGRRAYSGVPPPLLPHEVARQGLRPEWPSGMPPGCSDLRRLAELCWAQLPQDRPSFQDIMAALDWWIAGNRGWAPSLPRALPPPTGGPVPGAAPGGGWRAQQHEQRRPQQQQRGQRKQQQQEDAGNSGAGGGWEQVQGRAEEGPLGLPPRLLVPVMPPPPPSPPPAPRAGAGGGAGAGAPLPLLQERTDEGADPLIPASGQPSSAAAAAAAAAPGVSGDPYFRSL